MIQRFKSYSTTQKVISILGILFGVVCFVQIFVMNTFHEPAGSAFQNSDISYEHNVPICGLQYRFSALEGKADRLAFVMAQMPEDQAGSFELLIQKEEKTIYRGTVPCAQYAVGDIVEFPLNLALTQGKEYTATFGVIGSANPNDYYICGELGRNHSEGTNIESDKSDTNANDLIDNAYESTSNPSDVAAESGDTAIQPNIDVIYAPNLVLLDKLLLALYVLLILILFEGSIAYWQAIIKRLKEQCSAAQKAAPLSIVSIPAGALAYLALELSEITLDDFEKILIAAIVFLSTQWLYSDRNRMTTILHAGHNILYILLAVWTAFSVVGTQLFIEPLYATTQPMAYLVFLLSVLCAFPVVVCVCTLMQTFSDKYIGDSAVDDNAHKRQRRVLIGLISILTLISFLYDQRAFNPAISNYDTYGCMNNAITSIRGIGDWHPVFYQMWLSLITKFSPTMEAVVFVQFAGFAYVLIRGFLLLDERGLPHGIQYVLIVLCYLNCANMLHLTTIWKDIPYTLSVLWLTIILARLSLSSENRIFVYAELTAALVCTCLFRHQGIVPFLLVCALIFITRFKNRKMVLSAVCSIALVIFIKYPLYDYYQIDKTQGGGIYIGMGADLMGVYYNNGELSEDAVRMVEVLAKEDLIAYDYQPSWSNASYALDTTMPEFVMTYLDTFFKNPLLMSKVVLARMNYVWDIYGQENNTPGKVGYTDTIERYIGDDSYAVNWEQVWKDWKKRDVNYFTKRLTEITENSTTNRLLYTLEWRAGIWFLAVLLSAGVILIKKQMKATGLAFVPCAANVLALLLSTGWNEFRYVWPIQLMAFFLMAYTLTVRQGRDKI